MLIPIVDQGLERLLRADLALGEDVGDVSFDAPTGTWSAQLSRITVSAFLFGVSRSSQPARPSADRTTSDGRRERRPPSPVVELDYVLSVYAGSTRDEHQLLSDVLSVLVRHPVLPPEHLPHPLDSPVQLGLAHLDVSRMRDIWSSIGGSLRPAIELTVTAALDGLPWVPLPPLVERIEPQFVPVPHAATD